MEREHFRVIDWGGGGGGGGLNYCCFEGEWISLSLSHLLERREKGEQRFITEEAVARRTGRKTENLSEVM